MWDFMPRLKLVVYGSASLFLFLSIKESAGMFSGIPRCSVPHQHHFEIFFFLHCIDPGPQLCGQGARRCDDAAVPQRRIRGRVRWRSHRHDRGPNPRAAIRRRPEHGLLHVLLPAQEPVLLVCTLSLIFDHPRST